MPKTPFEKAIEKQMREQKRLAQKEKIENRRTERQRQRDNAKTLEVQQRINTALSIVNSSRKIGDMTIMNETYEQMLTILLNKYDGDISTPIEDKVSVFPNNIQSSIQLNFEVLKDYGMILDCTIFYDGSFSVYLTQAAIKYFDNKNRAQDNKQKSYIQIQNLNANGSNVVLGDLFNSSLSVDNSIQSIENEIKERGGEDTEELLSLFDEVKDYADNIQKCRMVGTNKHLFSRLKKHVAKNNWFYAEVVAFLGEIVLKTMG